MSSFLTIITSEAGLRAVAGPSEAAGPLSAAGPSEATGPLSAASLSAASLSAEAVPKEPALAGPKEEAIAGPSAAIAIAAPPKKSQTKVVPKDNEACPICMDAIGNTNCAKTSCGHSFCLSCIIECLNTNHVCPLCRKDIMEKKERSGKKLKMDSAVRLIEEEIEIFGLHQQIAMARQFGIRAIKTVVQSFALSTAHSIAIMQDDTDVDGSWEEMDEDDDDDSDAEEEDASDGEDADASDADEDASDGEVEEDASDADEEDEYEVSVADPSTALADPRVSIFDRLGPIREE
jgi:hypothetical protein